MTSSRRVGRPLEAKVVAFLALAAAIFGPLLVFGSGERRIADELLRNDALEGQLRAVDATLATRPALEAVRTRLRARVGSVAIAADAARVARFLADAGRSADAHRTRLAALTLNRSPQGSGARDTVTPAAAAFDISLEGRYVDVLATIRELSALRVPASVDVASMIRTAPDAANPRLAAALHVVLDPLAAAPPTDARTRSI